MAAANDSQGTPWYKRKLLLLMTIGILLIGIIVTVIPVLTLIFIAQPVKVQGIGMSPNLNDEDRIFVSKRIGLLQRGDIVLFYFPKDTSKSYIKRVVGLPKELVEIRAGKTLINGSYIEEPYLDPQLNRTPEDVEPLQIPEGNYFVMGDNRDNSSDSRMWGVLPKSLIYGKVLWQYWSSDRQQK